MRRSNCTHLRAVATSIVIAALFALLAGNRSPAQQPSPAAPEIRRGLPVDGGGEEMHRPTTRRKAFHDRLAGKAEPDRRGRRDRLPQYLELFKRDVVKDARLFAFDVRGRTSGSDDAKIVLDGFIEYPEQRDCLVSFLRALGFDRIEDHIATAPAAVGPEAKPFALVTSARTFLFDRTTSPRETVSECIIGEPLYLLTDEQDGHFLCHAADGYVGYVQANQVLRVDQKRFGAYVGGGDRAVLLKAVDHDGAKLPIGATLKAAAEGVTLPDGKTVRVDPQHLRRIAPDPRIERIVQTALQMAGTKYLWGGKTADGIDCSGLVQLAFRAHGVHLPRDSDQQAYVGELVATRWHRTRLRRGDTLFFLGRHGTITHTALYLGEDKYIEAAGPDVRISSFDPSDKRYAERNARAFCFARRVLQ